MNHFYVLDADVFTCNQPVQCVPSAVGWNADMLDKVKGWKE